jgi:hypothetical protein
MTNSTTGALVHRPTAPLPVPAVEALARLEAAELPVGPTVLAAQLRRSTARAAELADLADAGQPLTALEWDDLAHAEDLMSGAKATLAAAGRLDLIGGAV